MSQSPDALAGVVARVTEALREAQKHGRGTFDAMEPYEAVVAASIADEDIAALLAALAEAQASRAAVRAERDAEIRGMVEGMRDTTLRDKQTRSFYIEGFNSALADVLALLSDREGV